MFAEQKQPFYNMGNVISDPAAHIKLHHAGADGWITLAQKNQGAFRQYHYKPENIAEILSDWIGDDVYFSQNTFYKAKRRIENIRQLRALYVDIDCYNVGMDPAWVVGKLEAEVFGHSIPEPNIIIYSGRGIVPVWFIEPVPHKAMPLWQAIQKYLYSHLKDVGADPKALDASRIFRVAGSVNSKSGAVVQVQKRHENRYTLRDIQAEYLPELKPKQKKKGRPKKIVNLHNIYKLNWTRLNDLTSIVQMREHDMKGYRETACFLYRYWTCCFTNDPDKAIEDTLSFNAEFKQPLPEREVIRATESANRAFNGRGYKFTNETIIEWLGITEGEQRHLKTIIDKDEKQRRDTERKRKQRGSVTRGEYLKAQGEQSRDKLAQLKQALLDNPEMKRVELADVLGVSVYRVDQLKRELKSL